MAEIEVGIQLINPAGRCVIVPHSRVKQFIDQGFALPDLGWHKNTKGKINGKVIVTRPMGGLGDMICILPAIEQLAKNYDVTISFPKYYHFLFQHIKGITIKEYITNENINDYQYCVNLWCPAGHYEAQANFEITKSRVENFAEACGVEAREPKINWNKGFELNNKFGGKKLIGFQISSANPSKDWPKSRWEDLSQELIADGHKVISLDLMDGLENPGVFNMVGSPLKRVFSAITELSCMVAMDSGLMWAALAMGVKTVAMFGPTNGESTLKHYSNKNYRLHQNLDDSTLERCKRPCYYSKTRGYYCLNYGNLAIGQCMKEISVTEIKESIYDIIKYKKRGLKKVG